LCILGGVDHCDFRSYGKDLDINGLVINHESQIMNHKSIK
jgi:hypothetical protein